MTQPSQIGLKGKLLAPVRKLRSLAGRAYRKAKRMLNPDRELKYFKTSMKVISSVEACWMIYPERTLLFALVLGVRPQRVLEIGSFRGGSAKIIVAALNDIGAGKLVCVDPQPRLHPNNAKFIANRATVIAGPSPDACAEAERVAGGKFQIALIDGDHSYDGVIRDIEGTLPTMDAGGYMLFHDAFHPPVKEGIDLMIQKYPALFDVGMLAAEKTDDPANNTCWGGIRVVRFMPKA